MPSYFESLSMVALEAWALGKPVLANAKCDVLKGQAIRSNAGLYYEGEAEFVETLRAIEHNRWLAASLGRNGRQYYRDHYDWPVIEQKYLDMLQRLSKAAPSTTIEAVPGRSERKLATCPAAASVVAALPSGPVLNVESYQLRPTAPLNPPAPERPLPERERPAYTGRDRRGPDRSRRGPHARRGGSR